MTNNDTKRTITQIFFFFLNNVEKKKNHIYLKKGGWGGGGMPRPRNQKIKRRGNVAQEKKQK